MTTPKVVSIVHDGSSPYGHLIVTADQLKDGFVVKDGNSLRSESYQVLQKLSDGTYVVQNPHVCHLGAPCECNGSCH